MFKSTSKLIFLSVETKQSKKGNPYKIVTVADPATYEKLEFFCDDRAVISAKPNDLCIVELGAKRQGYATAMNCLAVTSA